ncbi:MAG: PIN domain-containing protein [Sulfuriferula sp.]
MELTYILVDFENVQPPDMGLLSGDHYQLRIFRGPHQKKLDFDIAESLQPHGNRVQYIQSDRHGKNALDFHIAFYMGRLIEELEADGAPACKNTRFVVISKDGGFDALMSHIQSLGYGAMKAASIRQALGLDEPATEAENAQQSTPVASSGPATHSPPSLPGKPPVAKKAAPAKKATPVKPAATPKKTAAAQAKPGKSEAKKPLAPARNNLGPEDKEKVIEHLRLHPKNRPVKRKTLESHITSLLGGNVTLKAVRGLIAGLENEKVIKFSENKIDEYKIPKRKK